MSGPHLFFLISLPRAGSTLLQRILATHPEVATAGEPWLLLPWIYAFREDGIRSEYGHGTWIRALRGLEKRLPDLRERILRHVRGLADDIYSELAGDAPIFLDKTPRYHLIVAELKRLFPDARFIVLFRSPADVWASSVRAFRGGGLRRMDHLDVDLIRGPANIAAAAATLKDRRTLVRYEDLVTSPESTLRKVCGGLGLEYHPALLTDYRSGAPDGLGDHRGIHRWEGIEDRRESWRAVVDSPFRRYRLLKYLDRVDDDYLELGNYRRETLKRSVREKSVTRLRPVEWGWWLEELAVRVARRFFLPPGLG